jgi:predicted metal-dependent hydrolase
MLNAQITIGSINIDVVQKDIKNVHLSVHPPSGKVSVSAPQYMELDTIRLFAISKLDWIRNQQLKIRLQEREAPRDYLNRESHYVWGKRYLLLLKPSDSTSSIGLSHTKLILSLRKTIASEHLQKRKHALLEAWYRQQIKQALPELLVKWEPIIGVNENQMG